MKKGSKGEAMELWNGLILEHSQIRSVGHSLSVVKLK